MSYVERRVLPADTVLPPAPTRGLATTRELAEITTSHGGRPAQPRGSIADLVPRQVGFGEDQLHDLCAPILAPRPTR